jgi:PAT family beta-lactamase induction signal transducer AmpG
MFSGFLQESIGYKYFFNWVILATIPGLILIKFLKIDSKFGIKRKII